MSNMIVFDHLPDHLFTPDKNHECPCTRERRIEQVSGQEQPGTAAYRNDNNREFTALTTRSSLPKESVSENTL